MRNVNQSDAAILLEWRNLPEVRKFSKQREKISRVNHEDWLAKRLDLLPAQPFWMFESDSISLGTTRFDLNPTLPNFKISISVNPDFRRRGIGKQILQSSIKFCQGDNPGAHFSAEAHTSNKISQQLFLGCGFRYSANKGEFLVYELGAGID